MLKTLKFSVFKKKLRKIVLCSFNFSFHTHTHIAIHARSSFVKNLFYFHLFVVTCREAKKRWSKIEKKRKKIERVETEVNKAAANKHHIENEIIHKLHVFTLKMYKKRKNANKHVQIVECKTSAIHKKKKKF